MFEIPLLQVKKTICLSNKIYWEDEVNEFDLKRAHFLTQQKIKQEQHAPPVGESGLKSKPGY